MNAIDNRMSHETATAILEYLSKRKRSTRTLNLGKIYRDLKPSLKHLSRSDVELIMRKLQEDNLGHVVYSRRKKAQQFLWKPEIRLVERDKSDQPILNRKITHALTKGFTIVSEKTQKPEPTERFALIILPNSDRLIKLPLSASVEETSNVIEMIKKLEK